MDSIPWDREVELFQAGAPGHGLAVTREKMTLRHALQAWLELPEDQRWTAGIGLHDPIRMTIDNREALVGWYNADGCRLLATLLPDQLTTSPW